MKIEKKKTLETGNLTHVYNKSAAEEFDKSEEKYITSL